MIQLELLQLKLVNLWFFAHLVCALGLTYLGIRRMHLQQLSKCIYSDWCHLLCNSIQISIYAIPVHGHQFLSQESNNFELLLGSRIEYRLGLYDTS